MMHAGGVLVLMVAWLAPRSVGGARLINGETHAKGEFGALAWQYVSSHQRRFLGIALGINLSVNIGLVSRTVMQKMSQFWILLQRRLTLHIACGPGRRRYYLLFMRDDGSIRGVSPACMRANKWEMLTMNTLQPPPAINPLTFIDRLIAEIELTPTQFENAERSYNAVAAVLNKPESLIRIYSPQIQPQGSMRIGTTVKPRQRKEFDLDMLCLLLVLGKGLTPHTVYEWVWNALGTDETYRKMRERRCRCIRINYADAFQFHLDVTPAIPDWNKQSTALFIPDRQQAAWCSTHPIGFADSFFKPIAQRMPIYESQLLEAERRFMAKAAVEPLPRYGTFEKRPLQRIVQMLKHDRDNYYSEKPRLIPSSILLTTITARAYAAEVGVRVGTLLEFVQRVVNRLPSYIEIADVGSSRRFVVLNPVNDDENFAAQWTQAHYNEFRTWHRDVVAWLQALQNTRGKGADVMLTELSARFDRERVIRAANSVGIDTRRLQEAETIRVNKKGTLGLVGTVVPKTVNFGA